jgi:hypothetical protein
MNTSLVNGKRGSEQLHEPSRDPQRTPRVKLWVLNGCGSLLRRESSFGAELPKLRRHRSVALWPSAVIPAMPQSMRTDSPLAKPLGGPKKATRFAVIDHTVRSAEKKLVECEFS